MSDLAIVVIGRNEGLRLQECLDSVSGEDTLVYVDSGSTDGSVSLAETCGARIVRIHAPYSAAKARNAGLKYLLQTYPDISYVQLLDGDCTLEAGWLRDGLQALRDNTGLAAVVGRLRERHPRRSIYNTLLQDEWDTAFGEEACGGIALYRTAALLEVGGFNDRLIAGEDSEMWLRLQLRHWRLRRLAAEMATHDAAMYCFAQWWRRNERAGFAYAASHDLHPDHRPWRRAIWSSVVWSFLVWLWPAKMAQLANRARARLHPRAAMAYGVLTVVGKMPQLAGVVRYYWKRDTLLIEYKATPAPPSAAQGGPDRPSPSRCERTHCT